MNLDSLTFETARTRNGKWTTHNPQFGIKVTAASRADAIAGCTRQAFERFYELDADRAIQKLNHRPP